MKLDIIAQDGTKKGTKQMPKQFDEAYRPDVIQRAVEVIHRNSRQVYGSDPRAGMKSSPDVSRRRRKYRGSYGKGISRVPRKVLTRNGSQMNWVGAFMPGTVGGRRAHPPKASKIWSRKINDKERKLAIRSALSATLNKELVKGKGHDVPAAYPFILDSAVESIEKAKEFELALEKLGFEKELERAAERKTRAGRARRRGRRYKRRVGPLVVVADSCPLLKKGQNIPGVKVVSVKNLNAAVLAPSNEGVRLTLFTENALNAMEKNNLFM